LSVQIQTLHKCKIVHISIKFDDMLTDPTRHVST